MGIGNYLIYTDKKNHNLYKYILVCIVIDIKNLKNGDIKTKNDYAIWDIEKNEPNLFNWKHGNYSCDCNRARFSGDKETECSEEKNNYIVRIYNTKDMSVIYDEWVDVSY